jgi:hypothetical protein
VKIVQILFPTPEIGDIILTPACYKRSIMALKTQGELLRRERTRIPVGIVGGEEQFGMGSCVSAVAICTLSVGDSRMQHFVILPGYLVAFPAQGGLIAEEKRTVFRCVGSVAIGAAAVGDRLVDHDTPVDHAVMALLAQPFSRTCQKPGVV